jgi:hypothetical protein
MIQDIIKERISKENLNFIIDQLVNVEELEGKDLIQAGISEETGIKLINQFYCLHPKLRCVPSTEFMEAFVCEVLLLIARER